MEASTTNIQTPMPNVANPTPMANAMPPATPTPSVEAPITTPTPTDSPNISMESGGVSSEGGVKGFLKSLNWIEVGLTILGVGALIFTIDYYRYKLREDKLINNELQRQIDEIKMNLQTNMKGKYKTI